MGSFRTHVLGEGPQNFGLHFYIWLTFKRVWQSLVEFGSATSEEGVRKKVRTRAKHNGLPCIRTSSRNHTLQVSMQQLFIWTTGGTQFVQRMLYILLHI